MFTDAVQDAAHRALLIEGRAFQFNLRSMLLRTIGAGPTSLAEVAEKLSADASTADLYAVIPPDFTRRLGLEDDGSGCSDCSIVTVKDQVPGRRPRLHVAAVSTPSESEYFQAHAGQPETERKRAGQHPNPSFRTSETWECSNSSPCRRDCRGRRCSFEADKA